MKIHMLLNYNIKIIAYFFANGKFLMNNIKNTDYSNEVSAEEIKS